MYKRQRNQKSNCQHLLNHRKSKGVFTGAIQIRPHSAVSLLPHSSFLTLSPGENFLVVS